MALRKANGQRLSVPRALPQALPRAIHPRQQIRMAASHCHIIWEGALTAEGTARGTSMAPLDAQGQFQELLTKLGVEKHAAIAEFMAAQGENASEDRSKKCDVCGRSFKTSQGLAAHR